MNRELLRPDLQCRLTENLLLNAAAEGQRAEIIKIALDVGHAGAGPIGAEERLGGDLFQARKILQQSFRWDAADIQIDIWMATDKKERGLHPKWTPAVRQQNLEPRKVYCNIVHVNRITELVACAGKN